ncbi:hypothetical protein [Planococcus sp. ISL-110]|uniref:hypothetical protein n=1 Tax=Planococcus sp. ISL-110 TaxID=2819167 RepID=UPI001BE603A8|nr:hypothetical protein [Planococcus sp. ISL-110]MBT2570586.1 hypothetical protein [Planococcus sp. ISL-110]
MRTAIRLNKPQKRRNRNSWNMQEKSSGIDVWEMLENLTGKSDYAQTIEQLHYELAEQPLPKDVLGQGVLFMRKKHGKKLYFRKIRLNSTENVGAVRRK